MTTKLVAGRIETNGTATSVTSDSMAKAIEDILNALVPPKANEDLNGRHVFVVAVARGVLQYLSQKHEALHVTTRNFSSSGSHEESVTIDVDLT